MSGLIGKRLARHTSGVMAGVQIVLKQTPEARDKKLFRICLCSAESGGVIWDSPLDTRSEGRARELFDRYIENHYEGYVDTADGWKKVA